MDDPLQVNIEKIYFSLATSKFNPLAKNYEQPIFLKKALFCCIKSTILKASLDVGNVITDHDILALAEPSPCLNRRRQIIR
jgi:hypothetical protein